MNNTNYGTDIKAAFDIIKAAAEGEARQFPRRLGGEGECQYDDVQVQSGIDGAFVDVTVFARLTVCGIELVIDRASYEQPGYECRVSWSSGGRTVESARQFTMAMVMVADLAERIDAYLAADLAERIERRLRGESRGESRTEKT